MTAHNEHTKILFERSASLLRVHGIVSIIFGAIGVFSALVIAAVVAVIFAVPTAEFTPPNAEETAGLLIISIAAFFFWLLPHIYLIVAGVYLVKEPTPGVAKVLVIINLIIGFFTNLGLLIFGIINLVQSADYENGYHKK